LCGIAGHPGRTDRKKAYIEDQQDLFHKLQELEAEVLNPNSPAALAPDVDNPVCATLLIYSGPPEDDNRVGLQGGTFVVH